MEVHSTKFGIVRAFAHDIIHFPQGLPGLEDCQQWILLAESIPTENAPAATVWLQSVERDDIALALAAPCRFVPHYRVRVDSAELRSLRIERDRDVEVLAVLNYRDGVRSINLKAPLVINMASRLGRQVINPGSWSMRHMIVAPSHSLRRSA